MGKEKALAHSDVEIIITDNSNSVCNNCLALLSEKLRAPICSVGGFRFQTKQFYGQESTYWVTHMSSDPFTPKKNAFRVKILKHSAKGNVIRFCIGASTSNVYRDSNTRGPHIQGVFLGGTGDVDLSWAATGGKALMHKGQYVVDDGSSYIAPDGTVYEVVLDYLEACLKFYINEKLIGALKVPIELTIYPGMSSMGDLLVE